MNGNPSNATNPLFNELFLFLFFSPNRLVLFCKLHLVNGNPSNATNKEYIFLIFIFKVDSVACTILVSSCVPASAER